MARNGTAKRTGRSKREPTVGAAWRSRKGLFTLVALADAERVTGLSPEQLRKAHGVQVVTRIYPDGSREEALRVPTELILEAEAA
jgi:hypothetical protein